MKDFVPPKFESDAFNCPHCEAYAHQIWFYPGKVKLNEFERDKSASWYYAYGIFENATGSVCSRCGKYALWVNGKIIYPVSSNAPLPLEDMPEDVKEDYLEARSISVSSSRAAAALLRLALQKLMSHLGETGKDLNKDIGNLVKKGLDARVQKALDSVRVIGNEAVHPGELDLNDDPEIASTLFKLLNMIVNVMITQPKEIDQFYDKLPENKKEGIINRDKAK